MIQRCFKFKWPGWRRLPLDVSTGGEVARKRAEVDLVRVRSETPYYESLGRSLRAEREVNHIAERLRAAIIREGHA